MASLTTTTTTTAKTTITTATATAAATAKKNRRKSCNLPIGRSLAFKRNRNNSSEQRLVHPRAAPPLPLLWLCCLVAASAIQAMADCPSLCECKWKSGKESVSCLNANFTHIPVPLDAGTQVLDLSGNEIVNIPDDTFAAAELLNLQKVYLSRCRLRVIERFAFRKLINLVELDLSYNQLSSIPAEAFDATPELRELKLAGNPIQRVPNEAFIRVPQLVRLDLADCKLSVLEVRAFAGLESSLEWLKLEGNQLSDVRAGTITSLSNLHGIELARNQWNCSCSLRPLRAWMLHENIPCGIPPLCRAPARLAGKPWDKIDLDDFACVPQIIATDTTAHGVEGRNVTMSCYVEGVPEPSVRWMVKNRVIANLSAAGSDSPARLPRTAAATQGRKTYVVNMLRNASNLTILTADMQDAGIYTCAAENKAGKVEASVTLAVSRRPPEAPLGVKMVILCVLIALLFVVGSSFAAICFCSLRRKRKMRLWNSVPPGRTESYEKIEMATRAEEEGGRGGRGAAAGGESEGRRDVGGANGGAGGVAATYCAEENGYLRSAATPLCGSDEGIAIINPSSAQAKRNGEYRNVPTHCDDESSGYARSNEQTTSSSNANGCGNFTTTRWKSSASRHTSPVHDKRKAAGTGLPSSSTTPSATTKARTKTTALEDTDLHIPRLIDIGPNSDSASTSISGQVDAAARLTASYTGVPPTWSTSLPTTTKITSPRPSKSEYTSIHKHTAAPYYNSNTQNNDNSSSVFSEKYPDLLDIAKYAVAQASKATPASPYAAASAQRPAATSSGLCTLPRKLKDTGRYFKNSSDSQSPLLADNSSKYGSSTLGDVNFLAETGNAFGRRYSAESSYSNLAGGVMHTAGQRSNSFLNLVQSCNKNGGYSTAAAVAVHPSTAATTAAAQHRNPSLPSSPVHEVYQHQRSFSSAATPLLDFSSLTTRAGVAAASAVAAGNAAAAATLHPTPVTIAGTATAYDYHAAQLERFLEEYRNLQDQLCKMKVTCDTIRKKEVPLRSHAAQLADPVMFNAALAASSPTPPPKATLKSKTLLPGQPPDPPPYWLHRNAMLKRLNDSQADIFKS